MTCQATTRIAEQLGARIADLEQRLADLVGKSVVERTAHTLGVLVAAAPAGREPGPVRLTHEQLAGLVGATRERTTRAGVAAPRPDPNPGPGGAGGARRRRRAQRHDRWPIGGKQ